MIINKGRFEFRCTPELHEAVKWAAYRRHLSVNEYIRRVLEVAVSADVAEEQARQAQTAAPATEQEKEQEGANGGDGPVG